MDIIKGNFLACTEDLHVRIAKIFGRICLTSMNKCNVDFMSID